jgi:hypothetical protein
MQAGSVSFSQLSDICVLHFQELLDIDANKTGQVLLQHVPQLVPRIVEVLQEEPRVLFQFLQGIFDYRWVCISLYYACY